MDNLFFYGYINFMKIGYIGLGRMGKNMVLRLLEQGVEVVAWNRSPEPLEEVEKAGAVKAESIEDLVKKLDPSPSAQDDGARCGDGAWPDGYDSRPIQR